MVADPGWLSPTRMAGLTAYTASFATCAWRWATCRGLPVASRLFAGLMAAQFFLLLDMAFDLRWKLHDLEVRMALAAGVYDQRRMPQLLVVVLLPLALVFVSNLIFRKYRHRVGTALALIGTLASLGLWCCEWVSYHYVDGLLYHMVGGVMLVSLAWIGTAVATCIGIWLDGLSRRRAT